MSARREAARPNMLRDQLDVPLTEGSDGGIGPIMQVRQRDFVCDDGKQMICRRAAYLMRLPTNACNLRGSLAGWNFDVRRILGTLQVLRWETALVAVLATQAAILWVKLLSMGTGPGFPIDDGYIYSTYVAMLMKGYPLQYNAGELSGGITSLAWYAVLALMYLPARVVWVDPQALVWVAYLAGLLSLTVTALLAYRLLLMLGVSPTLAKLLSLFLLMDHRLLWGAFSGLEVPLTAASVLTLFFVFLKERRLGKLRFTPYLAGIAPLFRPELVILPIAIGVILALQAHRTTGADPSTQTDKSPSMGTAHFAVRAVPLMLILPIIYQLATGLPLPTSIYAKGHAITQSLSRARLLSHSEVIRADLWTTIVIAAVFAAAVALCARKHPSNRAATITGICLIGFASANLVGGPFIGQMQRYLSPFDPLALVALGFLVSPLISRLNLGTRLTSSLLASFLTVMALAAIAYTYVFTSGLFVLHVRNMNEGPVAIAKWISKNTPTDAVVAAEPVGALGLFSGRRIVDIYGLTTPDMLGHYFDWEFTWQYLRGVGAEYFVYYPSWFPEGKPPRWLRPLKVAFIQDNVIAGDSILGLYRIEWPSVLGY